ncbi:NTE family protein [Hydrogenispora ethanolica]|uniref:NTE family protein n=1 Tax=Hydrogenispora ethanolica TaxID=1082276 RepID=A0A4V2QCC5_HYDET|nr:patatin-like phospholipase family protein [Hydrogenispora ethanolica]TCL59777.1 NTE family protein [Hydrogenispora ethanolica]
MNNQWIYRLLFFLILFFCSGSAVLAAEPARPRIGLALGGGSAIGFAHIGVLQWLEENRIPVDYVAGTSMGGLMGGCYAMGMSPAEIERFVKSLNWDRLFDSAPPYRALDFRRKEDKLDYPGEIEIGLKDKLYIPSGLSIYRVNLLLSRIALPYSAVRDFDELPIPYRCVATDIQNSEKVVLGDGSLSEAMRATMSLPGAFVPVERDGRLLVDGGLVDNVPADVAKAMGADLVIAVNCNQSNANKDLRRIDEILMSSINTLTNENVRQALKLADFVIQLQTGNLSSFDWNACDELIEAGYQSAARQGEELKKLALDPATWQEYLKRRSERKRLQAPVPRALKIQGTDEINQAEIAARLRPFIGKPVDVTALEVVLVDIMGSSFYESLRYEIVIQDQVPTLVITVREIAYGPPFVRYILQMNFVGDRADVNLRSRITAYNMAGEGAELRTDLSLGTSPGLGVELYKPFSTKGWFLVPRLEVKRSRGSLFLDGKQENHFTLDESGIGLSLGYSFNKFSEARLGYQAGYQRTDTIVGTPLREKDGRVRKTELRWSYRNANQGVLEGGVLCDVKADWYSDAPNASEPFSTAETSVKWVIPLNERKAVFTIVSAGAATSGNPPLMQQFTLGGPLRLGAYDSDEFRGDNYVLGTVGIIKDIGKPLGLKKMYLATFLENGGVFDDWSDIHCKTDFSLGLVSPTIFGTFYLGTSFGEGNQSRINFLLGRMF